MPLVQNVAADEMHTASDDCAFQRFSLPTRIDDFSFCLKQLDFDIIPLQG